MRLHAIFKLGELHYLAGLLVSFAIIFVCGESLAADKQCDPSLVCLQVLTCIDGKLYPTSCGPRNCDEPIKACGNEVEKEVLPADKECDSSLGCLQVLTCIDGKLYPTACGPKNCDKPIKECTNEGGEKM